MAKRKRVIQVSATLEVPYEYDEVKVQDVFRDIISSYDNEDIAMKVDDISTRDITNIYSSDGDNVEESVSYNITEDDKSEIVYRGYTIRRREDNDNNTGYSYDIINPEWDDTEPVWDDCDSIIEAKEWIDSDIDEDEELEATNPSSIANVSGKHNDNICPVCHRDPCICECDELELYSK